MKIYELKDFLKLENGTVFCNGQDFLLIGLKVKDGKFGEYSKYHYKKLFSRSEKGSYAKLLEDEFLYEGSYTSRDVMLGCNEKFVVLDKDDMEYLKNKFTQMFNMVCSARKGIEDEVLPRCGT